MQTTTSEAAAARGESDDSERPTGGLDDILVKPTNTSKTNSNTMINKNIQSIARGPAGSQFSM
jgi:hypothetical protein